MTRAVLDSDPTEPSTPADAGTGDAPDASPAPAPRKLAPRKAAAKKATPAPNAPQPPDPADAGTQAAQTPPRAPRKRAPRKAAADPAPAGTDASPAPQTDTATAGADPTAAPAKKAPAKRATRAASFSGGAAPAEPDTDAPPAKAPRKRAAKKASPETPGATGTGEGPSDPATAPAMAAPGVLFMAPAPDADDKPRRRRPAKKQAGTDPDSAAATEDLPAVETAGHPAAEGTQPAAAPRKRAARPKKATAAGADTATEDTASAPTTAEAATDAAADDDTFADPDDVREAAIEQASGARRRRRRGRRGRGGGGDRTERDDDSGDEDGAESGDADPASDAGDEDTAGDDGEESTGTASRRRRRRRRNGEDSGEDDPPNTVTHVREPKGNKGGKADGDDGVRGVKGSTRLEAKRQRRRDGRETTRRRTPILSESEFLARREAVDRVMAVRQNGDRTQIAVLEDGILVEHYVTRASATSYVGNVYLGRVQNVLPSMEAAFIDIGKGRNGVLYAGEVNWDAAGLGGKSRAIENALKSGDPVLVQVSKDPVGHKGARLTSQVSLPGRFLVLVPGGGMTGISRRLPDTERHRLKSILKKIVPEDAGVIVRTAAEGASEEDLTRDVERLAAQWESIQEKAKNTKSAPSLVHGEPDLATRVVRDVFNEDFKKLIVDGKDVWETVSDYIGGVAPDLADRMSRHTADTDLFHDLRVDEQLMKALDRKVYLPSGGSLVIDRTEAMTVIDVNTGKFIGSGGNLEQTVTRNNIEAAEEIVRQLRLRDVGGIVVIDFIDMVLESNRELVLRRLTECLGRDRTKHQVAEVTSLGLVQMTRKRVGEGLLEAFSENCEHCHGRGLIVHSEPVDKSSGGGDDEEHSSGGGRGRRKRGGRGSESAPAETVESPSAASTEQRKAAVAAIAAIHRAAEGDKPGPDAPELDELASGLFAAALDAKDGSNPAAEGDDAPAAAAGSSGVGDGVEGPDSVADNGPDEAAQPATPKRRQRRVATRPAGGPPVGDAAVVVVPVTEPSAQPDASDVAEPAAPVAAATGAQIVDSPATQPAEQPAAPARPRRRRAASRPAGPPTG